MRQAIAPFLATGVVLVGATAVIAHPVIPPPADIRVSASDFDSSNRPVDVLDPGFLQSIGIGRRSSITVVEQLLNGLVDSVSPVNLQAYATALTEAANGAEPAAVLGALTVAAVDRTALAPLASPIDNAVPAEAVERIVGALVDISAGFGEAGISFLTQVGMAPAVVLEIATMEPEEALRSLVAAPLATLTGHPALTGNPDIDKYFTHGALEPLINALVRNLPKPIGGTGGLIDEIDGAVTDVATDIRDAVDPAPGRSPDATHTVSSGFASDQQPSGSGGSQAKPSEEPQPQEAPGNEDEDVVVPDPTSTPHPPKPVHVTPGGIAKNFNDRVHKSISDLNKTVKGITDAFKPKPKPKPKPSSQQNDDKGADSSPNSDSSGE
jgi:hypothetical protein